ncbi:type II toxin-antitoxin system HicB family antitoxin [Cronbergia sp. UHCC 0137]|uniref:type II toxin-antitoxin system HicB family antitoxin n=1 Tax=Cronbergia sp. UHCC 0137 TaxID=3110239 RepID=UPI002B20EDA3|nr:type II toxin-antitoxin system HicB family antitoxin [Cronbergia sp. UHCC 0137]MEA5620102.1 type II toxin-antitoxin system HicB family antitoxin [Cronbergia sp. UHCC 0137]
MFTGFCWVALSLNPTYKATHGETYEEALKNGQEVLEMLIESCLADGESLPEPQVLGKFLKVA